jgi:hypothetical protein
MCFRHSTVGCFDCLCNHSCGITLHQKEIVQHITPSHPKRRNKWQYWILATVSRCCSWCTAWNRYGRNFSCFVARWPLVTENPLFSDNLLNYFCGYSASVSSTLRSVWSVIIVRRRIGFLSQTLCPEMLLSVGVLLSHSVLHYQDTHC